MRTVTFWGLGHVHIWGQEVGNYSAYHREYAKNKDTGNCLGLKLDDGSTGIHFAIMLPDIYMLQVT